MDPDTEYLKQNVGDAVAAGLAAVAAAKPEDPIQYLANFLLKHHENTQRQVEKALREKKLETERVAYAAELEKQKAQREEEEARQREEEERIRLENESRIAAQADAYTEEIEAQTASLTATRLRQKEHPEEMGPDEVLVGPTTAALKRYEKSIQALENEELKKTIGRELGKREEAPPKSIYKVVKAALYMSDHRKGEIADWESCRKVLRDYQGLIANIHDYEATGIQGKRRFARVRRLFNKLDVDQVKRFSFTVFLLYEWVLAAVDLYRAITIQRMQLARRGDDNAAADLEEEDELNKDEDEDEDEERNLEEPEFSDDEDVGPEPKIEIPDEEEEEDEDDAHSEGDASVSDLEYYDDDE